MSMYEIEALAEGQPKPAADGGTPVAVTAREMSDAEIIALWFNANIGPSAVARDPAVLEMLENTLPALVETLAAATSADAIPGILDAWVTTSIHNTAVSRDVNALNHLTASLPALARALAAAF